MSDAHDDEDINSISPSQSSEIDEDEIENGYESNETDSLNLDEEEEEDERGSFSIPCLSDRLVGGSLVLHIDQTGAPSTVPGTLSLGGTQSSTSTATSLSDTASENTSTRAVMGDTPSTAETNGLPAGEEDAADNSSQVSTVDSEAERVRRIHNSIFNSLENDLAELVRIREETLQFLETGASSGTFSDGTGQGEGVSGERNTTEQDQNNPFTMRERLTYYTRPFTTGEIAPQYMDAATTTNDGEGGGISNNMATLQARSYTPVAKFENATPAKPAKPYLEVGLSSCDEKAAAARKILDKLQYGDPEDEGACFVRRFWRETTTVVDNSPSAPLSVDVAAIAQRTASLQASLEEAFDGLRLRLQQVRGPESTTEEGPDTREEGEQANGGGGDADSGGRENDNSENNRDALSDYQNWDRETSIMNDPLNYDIWNELEDGSEAGPTITARINLAERRVVANRVNRQVTNNHSTTVAVGTDNNGGGNNLDGVEMDDESTDDEEMMSYFRFRSNHDQRNSSNNVHGDHHRPNNVPSNNMSQESREFFRDIGISDEMGEDLMNMFTLSEDDVQVPSNLQLEENSEMSNYEFPEPLFSRNNNNPSLGLNGNQDSSEFQEESNNSRLMSNDQVAITESSNGIDVDSLLPPPPQLPLFDTTSCIHIAPNREDECSTRIYLDENYLDFPYNSQADQNQDQ